MATKIESWLRGKQVAWNKDVEDGFKGDFEKHREGLPGQQHLKDQIANMRKEAVENFIEFAFSDDICFLDEDEFDEGDGVEPDIDEDDGFDPSEHMEPPSL